MTRILARVLAAAAVGLLVSGCGKPPMVSVKGRVTLDGKPVEGVKVGFFPDTEQFNPDKHGFGFGVTDKDGNYEVQHPQGDKGMWPGKYKVTLLLWVDKSGKKLPFDIKPSEVPGGVKNLFPERYEGPSTTPETADVGSSGTTKNIDVSSK